jgi:two-component system sensor histidine kinase HydH
LLANATEATRTGDHVQVIARRQGDRVAVEVVDSGCGMSQEQLAEVFRPFYTTKPRGMGLGLPLARRIVQRLGGDLQVASRPGAGTLVRVRLPVTD